MTRRSSRSCSTSPSTFSLITPTASPAQSSTSLKSNPANSNLFSAGAILASAEQPRTKKTNQESKMKSLFKSLAVFALLAVSSAFAGQLVNVSGASNAAVSGYDTVAFFTDAKPVNGSPFISAEYQGATYFF